MDVLTIYQRGARGAVFLDTPLCCVGVVVQHHVQCFTAACGAVVETAVADRQTFLITEARRRLFLAVCRLSSRRAAEVAPSAAVAEAEAAVLSSLVYVRRSCCRFAHHHHHQSERQHQYQPRCIGDKLTS